MESSNSLPAQTIGSPEPPAKARSPRRRRPPRAIVMGLHQKVEYKGFKFLVQTEHVPGPSNEEIVTQLFIGGVVIKTYKTSHERLEAGAAAPLQKQVRKQHVLVLRGLAQGKFDRRLRNVPKPVEVPAAGAVDPKPAPNAGPTAATGEIPGRPASPAASTRPQRPVAAVKARPRVTGKLVLGIECCCQALDHWNEALGGDPDHEELRRAAEALQALMDRLSGASDAPVHAVEPLPEDEFDDNPMSRELEWQPLPTAQSMSLDHALQAWDTAHDD